MAVTHRAPKGQSIRFVFARLRIEPEPLVRGQIDEAWCANRGLAANDATLAMLKTRIGTILRTLKDKGLRRRMATLAA